MGAVAFRKVVNDNGFLARPVFTLRLPTRHLRRCMHISVFLLVKNKLITSIFSLYSTASVLRWQASNFILQNYQNALPGLKLFPFLIRAMKVVGINLSSLRRKGT